MSEQTEPRLVAKLNWSRMAVSGMCVGAVLLTLAATLWMLVRFGELGGRGEMPTAAEFIAVVAIWLGAVAAGLLLWGVAEAVRLLDRLGRLTGGATELRGQSDDPAATQARARLIDDVDQLLELTRELRDINLLSDSERAMRLQSEGEMLARKLEVDVPILIREHNWVEAQRRLQTARMRFPALPNWDALEAQVAQARSSVEARDIEKVSREVKDLAALGAWDRAMQAIRHLQERHPDVPQVGELARRIANEREKATAEERARLMTRAQEATNQRRWREALRMVEEILARFPHSPEADELRMQLPTLRANTEVQVRQEMETQIRDLIKAQRYRDALRVARTLLQDYPASPQASVLRDQMPRLEQLAAEQV